MQMNIRSTAVRLLGACVVMFGAQMAFAANRPVVFGCDAAKGHTCFFTLSTLGGTKVQTFLARSGEGATFSDLVPNIDTYMVSIDQPPPARPIDCGVKYPCKRAFVVAGYNN